MTKRIEIGQASGHPLYLNVDTFMRTRMLVQAASGQGKSHWLRRLVEELAKIGVQVFVIDHEGEFATLRKEFDFFLAGEGGDLPIDVRTASVTARRFLEMRANCVFDLSDTFRLRPRDRHAWVKNFVGDGMMESPKSLWTPVVVIVDEAHKYMPESTESEASDAMISLATDGRKREFCMVAATQRLAKISKDGAAELLNKLIGGTSMGLDRKRAAEEMGVYGPDLRVFNDEIKTIERGMFWALGPAIAKERVLVKVGPTVTSAPARGSRAAAPPPAPAKVKQMLVELGDLAKVAEAKLQTEKDLRARIAELEKAARNAPKLQPITAKPAAVRCKITDKELADAIEPIIKDHTDKIAIWITLFQENLKTSLDKAFERSPKPVAVDWRKALSRAVGVLNKQAGSASPTPAVGTSVGSRTGATVEIQRTPIPTYSPSNNVEIQARGEISKPMMRILKALADLEAIGQLKPSRPAVAFWAETSSTSSSFQKNAGMLNAMGLITYPDGGRIAITDAGRRESPEAETLTSDEVFARGLDLLSKPQQRILSTLRGVYPEALDRENLAIASDSAHSSSSFQKNVGEMRTAGIVEYVDRGSIRAAEWLFF